jgi:hypothetical protein
MPIGTTARGDLVFPMGCRELPELRRDPDPSKPQPGRTQRADQMRRAAIPARPSAEGMIGRRSMKTAAFGGRTGSARRKAQSTNQNGHSMEQTEQPVGGTPNEERSSPTSHSGTVLSQSTEWFNPLGLH